MNASGLRDPARGGTGGPPAACKPYKKAPHRQPVHQAGLQHWYPAQGEVELCRADELAQRRGWPSELDEMGSDGGKQAGPR
jgi:hypothetical protein